MKSSVRVKRINGIEYLYEDTPYYDKEKKQIRHHSRYLGKNVNGEPKKVRSKLPHTVYNYGELLPFLDIIRELGVERHLDMMGDHDRNMLLSIGINRVCRPVAMHNLHYWHESSYLSQVYPADNLSGQHLGSFLRRVGDSSLSSMFHARLLKGLGTNATLVYDITSFSSRSENNGLLEYGYNRDGDGLPQLNLSMIVDKTSGVPVMYDVYPGSIVDVSTLKNTLHRLHALGVDEYTLVLDRGFFSTGNLEELCGEARSFIIPASLTLKSVREVLSNVQRDIDSPAYLHMYGKRPLFVKPIMLEIGTMRIKGYCYYDPAREQSERESFYSRLHGTLEKFKHARVPAWRRAEDVFKEKAGPLANLISWRLDGDGFVVEARKNAVSQHVNRLGKYMLLYKGEVDWQECLAVYREKDIVEKAFRMLKGDVEASPLNTQKEETTRGLLFACYIGLMLRMRLLRRMKETGLLEQYTVDSLLLELEKIKKIKLEDGTLMTSLLTRRHKDILTQLRLCA
jgi:transposase